MRPRSEIPLDRLVRNAERGEEFEILILHVLQRVRRNAMRREQPIRVARAGAIESELDGRAREPRHDAGLEVHLEIDDEIEPVSGELLPNVGERRETHGSVEDENFINRPVAANERRGRGLQHPGDMHVGRVPLQRIDHRQDVHGVADRAHHDDAHAAERGRDVDHGEEVTASASISRSIVPASMPAGDGR